MDQEIDEVMEQLDIDKEEAIKEAAIVAEVDDMDNLEEMAQFDFIAWAKSKGLL